MNGNDSFAKAVSDVMALWKEQKNNRAFDRVEQLRREWSGNPHLLVLSARLIQLQEKPTRSLEDAKELILQAVELDPHSPEAAIELGYFLDNVEDDPDAASKSFSRGIAAARQHLIEGLLGQTHVLLELDDRDEAVRCLVEAMHLAEAEKPALKKLFSTRIEELLKELGQLQPA